MTTGTFIVEQPVLVGGYIAPPTVTESVEQEGYVAVVRLEPLNDGQYAAYRLFWSHTRRTYVRDDLPAIGVVQRDRRGWHVILRSGAFLGHWSEPSLAARALGAREIAEAVGRPAE